MSTILNNVVNNSLGASIAGFGAVPPTSGQFLLPGGSNGTSWNGASQVLSVDKTHASLQVKGQVIINGVDLEKRLATIEQMLQIPQRDVTLEYKHPKLKKLYDEYIAALGKYSTFEAIKGEDDGTT